MGSKLRPIRLGHLDADPPDEAEHIVQTSADATVPHPLQRASSMIWSNRSSRERGAAYIRLRVPISEAISFRKMPRHVEFLGSCIQRVSTPTRRSGLPPHGKDAWIASAHRAGGLTKPVWVVPTSGQRRLSSFHHLADDSAISRIDIVQSTRDRTHAVPIVICWWTFEDKDRAAWLRSVDMASVFALGTRGKVVS